MSESGKIGTEPPPRRLGIQPGTGFGAAETAALALTILWLLLVAVFFLTVGTSGNGAATALLTLLGIFLPVILIWTTALTLRGARTLRDETAELHASIEALRRAYIAQSRSTAVPAVDPDVSRRIDALAEAQKKTETALAVFTSRRDAQQVVPSADRSAALAVPRPDPNADQASLALGTPPEALAAPISMGELLQALHFPQTRDDTEGFAVLRRALQDMRSGRVIRAAQDVLTLLSENGLYMDDLQPDRTRPELWRAFAAGVRGGPVTGLGAIRDDEVVLPVAARMREDPVFRDAAHHFLRQFDRTLADFDKTASDADLVRLSETRSARAFMLIGRAAGIFD